MKKVARILSLAIAFVMLISVFAACGSQKPAAEQTSQTAATEAAKTEAPKEPISLKMWGGVPPEAGPQLVCDSFNKEFESKGIKIEYERFVNDDQGNLKLDTNLLSGSDIDIYMTYAVPFLKKRAEGNMALDLSELMQRDGYDLVKSFGPMGANYTVNGKPYSLPSKMDQYGILINKKMFDEAGIPVPTSWTIEEFREIAKKLTKGEGQDKVYGMFFNTAQDPLVPFGWAANELGGDAAYKADGKESNFDNPVFNKYVTLVSDMMNVDKSAPTHVDSVTQKLTIEGMFLSGKTAMSIGTWIIRNIKDREKFPHDFATAIAPFPVIDKNAEVYTQGGLGDHISINPKSKNIEAAWEFVKWYCEKGMLPMVKFGRVPSHMNFDKELIVKEIMTGAEDLLDAASVKNVLVTPQKKYAAPTIMTKAPEIKKIQTEEIESVYIGKKKPDEGLAEVKKRSDEVLKQP